MYLVLARNNNYMHGVFPYSEEGKKQAEAYIKKATQEKKEEFYIQER